jgi:hypothetical protein
MPFELLVGVPETALFSLHSISKEIPGMLTFSTKSKQGNLIRFRIILETVFLQKCICLFQAVWQG